MSQAGVELPFMQPAFVATFVEASANQLPTMVTTKTAIKVLQISACGRLL